MDWYYMRKKVMTIQIVSEFYMLTDKSDNFSATEEFVDRRVQDFEYLESFVSSVSLASFLGRTFSWSCLHREKQYF
jgi:ubiquinone biosynthesis protein COQ9